MADTPASIEASEFTFVGYMVWVLAFGEGIMRRCLGLIVRGATAEPLRTLRQSAEERQTGCLLSGERAGDRSGSAEDRHRVQDGYSCFLA